MPGFDLSVNLDYVFLEAGDLPARIHAAAAAGYRLAELFGTAPLDLPSVRRALDETGLRILSVVNDPRVTLWNPDGHDEFLSGLRSTAAAATELGASYVVVPTGIAVPFIKRPQQLALVADAITKALPIAEEYEVTLLMEPVNTRVDHPGVLLGMTADAVALIEHVGSPRVGLLYDVYHSVTEGESPAEVFPAVKHHVVHVQVADAPGRGEPGSGSIDWPAVLDLLRREGYTGTVGIECTPTTSDSRAALRYFTDLVAQG
jgi:hydroxypyruvate isomerase